MPKVIFNKRKELIYMSRAPIPSNKNNKFKRDIDKSVDMPFPKKV